MEHDIGIIQGRLSPDTEGRFHFFPLSWQEEFLRAQIVGLKYIEWLADWRDANLNPLCSGETVDAVKTVIKNSGVQVRSICADYFMKYGFLGNEAPVARLILRRFIKNGLRLIPNPVIVIPFLEEHAISSELEKGEILYNVTSVLREFKGSGVRLAFETELPASELLDFIERFQSADVGVCYDTGNCTSYGFDTPKDIRLLSGRIFDVHIKDRKVGEITSMVFGEGDADLQGCFAVLKEIGYAGLLVLEAWRGVAYMEDARRHLLFVQNLLHS